MKILSYHVTLLEPALLSSLEGDPNERSSYDYIPGSVLRGAVIAKYMVAQKIKQLDIADEKIGRLFFNGAVRYLNGYPLDRLGNRTLPVPLSWHQEKMAVARQNDREPAPIYDFTVKENEVVDQPQGVKAPFCYLFEDGVRFVRPGRQLSIHTARNRRFGRAVKEFLTLPGEYGGSVYRYEALSSGQTFAALVLCETGEDAKLLKEILEDEIFLGGSRSAGYGRAQIENVKELNGAWREAGGTLKAPKDGRLTVTFLSDVLLRDRFGQFVADHLWLTSALESELDIKLKLVRAFLKGKVVGGFNRKWGLPLPQIPAVSMGSVLVYEMIGNESCSVDKLKKLEEEGIGERKAEGFGRLVFNWHDKEMMRVESNILPEVPLPTDIKKDEESKKAAQIMVTRMFQKQLESKLVARAVEYARILVGGIEDKPVINRLPSNAQISRFRSIVADALMGQSISDQEKREPDLQKVRNYLKDISSRKTARKQYTKAKIEGQTLLEWLENVLDKTGSEDWEELFRLSPNDYVQLGGVKPEVDENFRKMYLLRFIDAVMATIARIKKEVDLS